MSSHRYDQAACGERIKQLRVYYEYTQDEFAQLIHTTRSNIAKIEIGFSAPSIDLLGEIRNHFPISIDYLLFGEAGTPISFRQKIHDIYDLLHELEVLIQNVNTIEHDVQYHSHPSKQI